ncbi:hypothetical protein [Hyphomonas sp.]|uniref:hypothetical protein n=1 Tax=Hyphomonas sp. TaxID=87 RepID=UPI0025C451CC|nr:hypothetical protein [Hyphomonas sp.]
MTIPPELIGALLLAGSALLDARKEAAPLPPPTPAVQVVCPRETEWSRSFRDELAREVETIPHLPSVQRQFLEHIKLRAEARACRKGAN